MLLLSNTQSSTPPKVSFVLLVSLAICVFADFREILPDVMLAHSEPPYWHSLFRLRVFCVSIHRIHSSKSYLLTLYWFKTSTPHTSPRQGIFSLEQSTADTSISNNLALEIEVFEIADSSALPNPARLSRKVRSARNPYETH
jgi:hypothetical protein